jgi:hypothetical protein
MSPRPNPIRIQTTLIGTLASHPDHPSVTVDLAYTPGDPWAVALTFHEPAGTTEPTPVRADNRAGSCAARWYLSRDLLTEGLRWPCGAGDVRITPSPLTVAITLRPPGEAATVYLPRCQLADFLDDTNALVPPGTEARHVDLDQFLESLL